MRRTESITTVGIRVNMNQKVIQKFSESAIHVITNVVRRKNMNTENETEEYTLASSELKFSRAHGASTVNVVQDIVLKI